MSLSDNQRGRSQVRGFGDLVETLVTLFFSIFDPFLNYDPSIGRGAAIDNVSLLEFELSSGVEHYGEYLLVHLGLMRATPV